MHKVVINGKLEYKHIDQIIKSQTTEDNETKDVIWDNTIPLTIP